MSEQNPFTGVIVQLETCGGKTRISETHYKGYRAADGKKHFTYCSGRSYPADAAQTKSTAAGKNAA